MTTLIEGIDFYYNSQGLMVLSESYLLKRGHCCRSACLHCPYQTSSQLNPDIPQELLDPWQDDLSQQADDPVHDLDD